MTLNERKKIVEENLHKVTTDELDMFNQNFAYVYTRNSACMEGYDITLEEVVSITKGFSVKCDGTLSRSIYNHYKAYQKVKDAAIAALPLTEDFLKDTHEVLLNGIIAGGLYRNVDIMIKGSNHIPCSYIKVYDRMGKFFYQLNNYQGNTLEKVAYAHLQIAKVHPFLDGNGRLARLMMNHQLITAGYLPISIPVKRRKEYFDTLEEYKVNKTIQPFVTLLEDLLNKEYDRLIAIINKY